ncbi:MAG: hypothetical protein HKN09_07865 [Saprospiraceae bacterium]|nr:hypothetical protein [Saprospiraceae bacterium]
MKTPLCVTVLLLAVLLWSCAGDQNQFTTELDTHLTQKLMAISPDGTMDYYKLPNETDLDNIPQDNFNPLNEYKVALGQQLFFETGLGTQSVHTEGLQSYSCATCHIPSAGFTPGQVQGVGDGGIGFGTQGEGRHKNQHYAAEELDIQSIRPLSVINVAYVNNTFWNGQFGATHANEGTESVWDFRDDTKLNQLGYKTIETQNIIGLLSHRLTMDESMAEAYGYKDEFDKAFPEIKEELRYSPRTTVLAISAYLRTIIANRAPFQKWLQGENNALSENEKEGAILFFGKAQCYNCHYEKNLGSNEFHALGVKDMDQNDNCIFASPDDRRNLGRGGFTLADEDLYKFRVPGIYNVSDYESYFHGSSKYALEDVIDYKLNAVSENERVSQDRISIKLQPVGLSESEKSKLIEFIEHGLRDPDMLRYQPQTIGSGNCFPNNDLLSREDLDCN